VLVRAGYAVRAATRRPVSFPKGVEVAIVPDFTIPVDWTPILRGVDVVVHAASLAHADAADNAFGVFDQVNSKTTEDLARAAAETGIDRFLYISTVRAQVGASAACVVREQDEPRPTDHYGRTKLAAELAVRAAGVPFTILRPVVVYGPQAKGNVKTLVRMASLPLPLPFAGFDNRRSLLGIDNLISAILFVFNNPAAVGETYLVADPTPITLREIFTMLRTPQGRRPGLIYIPPKFLRLALILANCRKLWERLGEELVVDTGKLEALGWRPVIDTRDGLLATLREQRTEAAWPWKARPSRPVNADLTVFKRRTAPEVRTPPLLEGQTDRSGLSPH
jgi:UDP-glucose 4-epimerase